ncbi:MAG: MFS transporter [Clostridia bacterium]|nr:MFS transporter [Clostridia bacterium]MBO5983387.1 MFS transporter [Clostridia bacterium]MBO7326983.1 MFS transporter [Clostridia bacterium]
MKHEKNLANGVETTGAKKLKLDYGQTFKVGLAFAGIILFWNAYDFVIPLLLENTYGLPNALRGFIMGLDNLLSLFMLPLFGKLSDNSKGKLTKKFGRRTPFIVIGTICAIILMVFVPVATLGQQAIADDYTASIEAKLNDDQWMESLLSQWYDNAVAGKGEYYEVDIEYLNNNGIDREHFVSIRFDEKLTSKKALLLFGEETFYYDGVEISDLNAVAPNGRTYQEIIDSNKDYKTFVASSINGYIGEGIYEEHTTTKSGISSLAVYMVILLLVLVAMASFRSPAVALMPDVTPKPLRSQANAIINLCGGIGGAIAFLIYTVVLFGERLHNYVIIFGSVAGGMLLILAAYIALVNEKKMVKRCQEICEEYGIDDFEEDIDGGVEENVAADVEPMAEEKPEIAPEILEIAKAKTAKTKSPKEWWTSKPQDERQRLKSFWLILASIFMWFMGYNAVSSNLSVYTTKALNLSAGLSSIISGASMVVSAIAFIPVGYMAAKIGRRKSIIIGFALAVASFVLVCFAVRPSDNVAIPSVLFTLFYLLAGFGLIIANVNTFPMVTELSTAETVGQYTGYYYVATMSAQAITPMIGGAVMDAGQDKYLFLYSAVCIVVAIVLMCFVKHGDSKAIPSDRKLTKEEKRQIRLEALDSMD